MARHHECPIAWPATAMESRGPAPASENPSEVSLIIRQRAQRKVELGHEEALSGPEASSAKQPQLRLDPTCLRCS
jgi:hypothetical protein